MSILRPAMCGIVSATHGNTVAKFGTNRAKVAHLKSGTRQQPAALPSHFCFAKDARELRARDISLDSLNTWPLERPE
ncbi:hypothetical protein VAT7223_01312 [Vibrio atlanticus]|uniref:Uncharacterized protein n=1 Tax=Vibrio atlanticus TaxID=693153 RepID=A0A1C3IMJ6_9VIBR|nr:hypothetical protein VAT7223_01312 [Vibrio atlanticus]